MRVLTQHEAVIFQAEHGLDDSFSHLSPDQSRTEYTTDMDRRCFLANEFTPLLITDSESIVCLNIIDWNVGPSAQELDLFYAHRRSYGEPRLLIDAHFHVFSANEANEFRNILHLALISLFDIAGASTTTDFRFYASHDEWIDVAWHEDAPWSKQVEALFRKGE